MATQTVAITARAIAPRVAILRVTTVRSPWEVAVDLLFPEPNPYLTDPVGWVRDKLGEFMWSKQREIAGALVKHRYVAVKSCHDSGKSQSASRIVAWWLETHQDPSATTTAPTTKKQVHAILWRYLGQAHRKGGLPGQSPSTTSGTWALAARSPSPSAASQRTTTRRRSRASTRSTRWCSSTRRAVCRSPSSTLPSDRGVAPIPASTGKTHRHRLNRGGDRAANNALYTVVLTRLRLDPRTRAYFTRRRAEGLSKREITRCLQRYVARELYQLLVRLPASSSSWPIPRVEWLGQPSNPAGAA